MTRAFVIAAVVRGTVRRPAFWLLISSLWFVWRGLETFMPLGLTTEGLHRSATHYEITFVGGCIAMLLAAGPLGRMGTMFRATGPIERTLIETACLLSVAFLVAFAVLVPAAWLDLWQFAAFDAGSARLAGALGWLHFALLLTAISLRGGRPGAARGGTVRLVLSVVLAVVLPGLLVGSGRVSLGLLRLLDAGGILRMSFDLQVSGAQWMHACVPIVGWAALAALTAAPARPNWAPHALRHPR